MTAGSMLDPSPTRAGPECPPSDLFDAGLHGGVYECYKMSFMAIVYIKCNLIWRKIY